jgi:diguanylate cyclase (GGDEF)-like protein
MGLTVLPLLISAVVVHVWLHRGAVDAFDDVASRFRDELTPIQRLELALWEGAAPLGEYVDSGDARHADAYRAARGAIDTQFAQLERTLERDAQLRALVDRAAVEWTAAEHVAGALLAEHGPRVDSGTVREIEALDARIGASVQDLRTLEGEVSRVLEADHASAERAYTRATWASVIAAVVSLVLMALGVTLLRRILIVNLGRLVEGARRFADGDRGHRIAIQVPPELREVAGEFNRMIARIHEVEDSLVAQARLDGLTGLHNRRAFEENVDAAFARMRRMDEPFVLVMLDIDHFKWVNDTYGHATGDDVLRSIGTTLKASLREVDQAFRTGGEEFAILLPGADLAGARVACERLRSAVMAMWVSSDGIDVRVTASMGLAAAHLSMTPYDLSRAADRALYAAKAAGRNRVLTAAEEAPPASLSA